MRARAQHSASAKAITARQLQALVRRPATLILKCHGKGDEDADGNATDAAGPERSPEHSLQSCVVESRIDSTDELDRRTIDRAIRIYDELKNDYSRASAARVRRRRGAPKRRALSYACGIAEGRIYDLPTGTGSTPAGWGRFRRHGSLTAARR